MTIAKLLAFTRCATLLALFTAASASAQPFPSKPIRFVLPYPPGASLDVFARTVGDGLRPLLDQPVIVENRPGAGGTVAAAYVAQSPADGHTLFVSDVGPLVIARATYKSQTVDPVRDFDPVALGAVSTLTVTVTPSSPAKSVVDLIALARSQPGKINFSSSGSGTIIHTAGELFALMAGLELQHVPYKGGAPAVTALMTGEVQLGFPSLPTILQQAKAGKVRILAVTQGKRSDLAPDIPTVAEAGLPGYEVVFWQAIVAPRGTPRSVIDKLNQDIVAVLNKPDVKARLAAQGLDVTTSTPDELGSMMRREAEKWATVVRKANIRAE